MNTPDQFVHWLQGFFELSESTSLSDKQVQVIKDHLKLVFTKVTPDRTIDPFLIYPGINKEILPQQISPINPFPFVPPTFVPNPPLPFPNPPYETTCTTSVSDGTSVTTIVKNAPNASNDSIFIC